MTLVYYSNINSLFQEDGSIDETRLDLISSYIPAERLSKADNYKQIKDKVRSICASYLLCYGIDKWAHHCLFDGTNEDINPGITGYRIDTSLHDLSLKYNADGKPYAPDYPGLHFSISHSGDYVVCAFADTEIGCDIQEERSKNDYERIAARYYTESENIILNNIKNADQKMHTFYRIWSAKEAYIKFTGLGIREGLTTFSVDLDKKIVTSVPGHPLAHLCEPLTLIRNTLTICIGTETNNTYTQKIIL